LSAFASRSAGFSASAGELLALVGDGLLGLLVFGGGAAERAGELGDALGAEEQEHDDDDQQDFGGSEGHGEGPFVGSV